MKKVLVTDASYCPRNFVGGFGYLLVSGHTQFEGHHRFSGFVNGSSTAELKAIANSLYICLRKGYIKHGDEIELQTDSLSCVKLIRGQFTPRKKQVCITMDFIIYLQHTFSLKLTTKHVKGHNIGIGLETVRNHYVDTLARKGLEKALIKLEKNNR